MKLISNNKNNEKTIEFSVEEYENLLVILDQAQLPEHHSNLRKTQNKLWNDLYDMDFAFVSESKEINM